LKKFLVKKDYGSSIKTIVIGIKCVSPQFEQFFKPSKPKYNKSRKEIKTQETTIVIENNFSYDIVLDFNSINNATQLEVNKIVAKKIIESLFVFDNFKSKIKDFNVEKFKSDLEDYFRKYDLIG
jgi:hypothetical protein